MKNYRFEKNETNKHTHHHHFLIHFLVVVLDGATQVMNTRHTYASPQQRHVATVAVACPFPPPPWDRWDTGRGQVRVLLHGGFSKVARRESRWIRLWIVLSVADAFLGCFMAKCARYLRTSLFRYSGMSCGLTSASPWVLSYASAAAVHSCCRVRPHLLAAGRVRAAALVGLGVVAAAGRPVLALLRRLAAASAVRRYPACCCARLSGTRRALLALALARVASRLLSPTL